MIFLTISRLLAEFDSNYSTYAPQKSHSTTIHPEPQSPNPQSPSPIAEFSQANVIKTDQAFTKSICLKVAVIHDAPTGTATSDIIQKRKFLVIY